MRVLLTVVATLFFASGLTAEDAPIKEYSSDNRLMMNVVTAGVLDNGMVIHTWEWNDTAKALDAKYGASEEDGGYAPTGLIAQDVEHMFPEAVIKDENGYLMVDLPVLMDMDDLISKLVLEGGVARLVQVGGSSGDS